MFTSHVFRTSAAVAVLSASATAALAGEDDPAAMKTSSSVGKESRALDGHREAEPLWKSFSFLEACMRAYPDGSADPVVLFSGLEDYFLGTYYLNKGLYANDLARPTQFDPKARSFSAYRFHDEDPVFFRSGLRPTCRCGETEDGSKWGRAKGDPSETVYLTYAWVYQWPTCGGDPVRPR